jgi:hypothetical protein
LFRFQRIRPLAIEALERAPSLAARRKRQNQIFPAVRASRSFSLAHAIILKLGNFICLSGLRLKTGRFFRNPVEHFGKTDFKTGLCEQMKLGPLGSGSRPVRIAATIEFLIIPRRWREPHQMEMSMAIIGSKKTKEGSRRLGRRNWPSRPSPEEHRRECTGAFPVAYPS